MPIKHSLLTSIKRTGKRSPLAPVRLANIAWVKSLDRTGLSYEHKEAMLDLHLTSAGETISIQYPGKESDSARKSVYQYDFRPKVKLSDGRYSVDLTFFQIWEALLDNMPSCLEARALIGVIFYRMAHMVDYVDHRPLELNSLHEPICMDVPSAGYLGLDYESLKPFLGEWSFGKTWAGMSFEAFLRYNDLLALNEDVKYWYRATALGGKEWKADGVGRVNTMLTHLTVIGFQAQKVHFASLIERFSRSKGVCPANKDEAISICAPYLVG